MLLAIHRCGGRARAVTVNERRQESAVDDPWNRRMKGLWREEGDAFLGVPVGLDLVTVLVEAPAPVAVGEMFRVKVLKRLHMPFPFARSESKWYPKSALWAGDAARRGSASPRYRALTRNEIQVT